MGTAMIPSFEVTLAYNSLATCVIATANSACILWASCRNSASAGSKRRCGQQVYLQPSHSVFRRAVLQAIAALNVISPLAWLGLAFASLAYRNEVSKSLRATSPLLAVILALLVAFNLSALVLFVVHMHVFCGHRTCFGAGTDLGPEMLPLVRTLPPVHPGDKQLRPPASILNFMCQLDSKLQKLLGHSQASQTSRRCQQQPISPFMNAQPQSVAKQQRPSSTGSWHAPGSGHSCSQSYSCTLPSNSASSSLRHAASAPVGSMQHYLDRNFMATVQMQSRLSPHLSVGSTMQTCGELRLDAELPGNIAAHRPEPQTAREDAGQSLQAWGESLSVSVAMDALAPLRAPMEGSVLTVHDNPLLSRSDGAGHLTGGCAQLHCPVSVESELDGLLGRAVQGVLL